MSLLPPPFPEANASVQLGIPGRQEVGALPSGAVGERDGSRENRLALVSLGSLFLLYS
jgi:hypothetical protein